MSKTVFEVIGMGAKKYGGFEKYIVEEARQLSNKGYKLVVIFDREPIAKEYVKDLENLGVSIEILPQTSSISFAKGFWHLLKLYKPEIVHTNFSSNLFYVLPLSLLYGVKRRIVTEHCLPESDRKKIRFTNQLSAILANKILPVSEKSTLARKKGVRICKNKIATLYLGVVDACFNKAAVRRELGIADDTIALMNIAYHNPVKGVDVLLDAMNIIINERGIQNIVLYQIGGGQVGSDTVTLHNKAKQLGIESNVVWMGIRNDVQKLLFGGDIYVQPSRSEGIPLSIMEASIASLPVVATNVGGIPEAALNGVNAFVVPPESPEKLADAIIQLNSDSGLRKLFGKSGRELALNSFCLERNVSQLIKGYYRL